MKVKGGCVSPLSVFRLKKPKVGFPFVPHDLTTSETPDWDDHFWMPEEGAKRRYLIHNKDD